MEFDDFSIRIIAALFAGLFIGVEREIQNKNAGLKTNMLVSVGAAVFVSLSMHFRDEEFVDITRVMGQVVSGIGFIGAGVILHRGTTVKGLNTAATIWCSAAAGCLAAVGLFKELALLAGLIVFVNVLFRPVNDYINRKFGTVDEDKKKD